MNKRTEFVKTDLFPKTDTGKFDLIVSNPPYIATEVLSELEPEVRDYEPRIALDGNEDGLYFYRRIIEKVPEFIFSSGYLIMEIGYDQAEDVRAILEKKGCFHDIEVVRDFSGNNRVIKACCY